MGQKFVSVVPDEKKYAMFIIGGSLFISFATILTGHWLLSLNGPLLPELAYGIIGLGWVWVTSTALMGLHLREALTLPKEEVIITSCSFDP